MRFAMRDIQRNSGAKARRLAAILGAVLSLAPAAALASNNDPARAADLPGRVRHELIMLPYFTIFDNLSFQVDARVVTLTGQVRDPVLKSDAANVVKGIPGVESVVNNIQVLPVSQFDDGIRLATARAIYGYGPLQRYGLGALPPIHIIVSNGRVTLTGSVLNSMDKTLVYMQANQVPGVFSVQNDLQIEQSSKS